MSAADRSSARAILNPSMPMDVAKVSMALIDWSGVRSQVATVPNLLGKFATSIQSFTDRTKTVKFRAAIGLHKSNHCSTQGPSFKGPMTPRETAAHYLRILQRRLDKVTYIHH
jgi:hypothetical protein